MDNTNQAPATDFAIISPAFRDGAQVPVQYTCRGQNVNPPLNFFNAPPESKGLALIMHDPDAPAGDYTHWLVWDIPTSTETIAANSVPVGAVQGTNSSDSIKYIGPCPPKGTGDHRYIFEAYAMDRPLLLPSGATRQQLEQAMYGRILATAVLTGIFSAEN